MKKYAKILLGIIIFSIPYNLSHSADDFGVPEDILVNEYKPDDRDSSEIRAVLDRYKDHERKDRVRPVGRLRLTKKDVRLVKGKNGEYFDLIIRKKTYINSILITNYYWKHNQKKVREYGLRSLKFNWVNGNEKRLYKKYFIGKKQGLYFLVDSSTESDRYFGEAFRIRIPKYVVYGYRKGNEIYGILRVKDGIKLNIRTFTRKYSDYKGKYKNNPITLVLKEKPLAIKDHPVVTKVKEILEEDYIGVYVQYESKNKFFKSFLVREESEKNFTQIGFSNDVKEHRRAVLLEAYYKGGVGRILKAIIYFKRSNTPKTYYVTAIDKRGVHSVGRVVVHVPAIDQGDGRRGSPTLSDLEDGEYWYNEGDFRDNYCPIL